MYFPDLDSTYYIWEIGKTGVGKAFTVDILHLSEASEYGGAVSDAPTVVGMLQDARTPQGWEIHESTPKGLELWYDIWKRGYEPNSLYTNLFFPWWWQLEYRMPYTADEDTLSQEERQMIAKYNLDLYQIAWRRQMIHEKGTLFFQEYPEDEESCWLGREDCVFDVARVKEELEKTKRITPAIDEYNGALKIWKAPVPGGKYVAATDLGSGDTSGSASVTTIMEWEEVEVVAQLHCFWPIDIFMQRSAALCRIYNNAFWGIERAGIGHAGVQAALRDLDYGNLYRHKDYDGKFEKVGWVTSGKSRPRMITQLQTAIREGWLKHPDPEFWRECLSFVRATKRPDDMGEAAAGAQDDRVMSTAIALQLRYHFSGETPRVVIEDAIPRVGG